MALNTKIYPNNSYVPSHPTLKYATFSQIDFNSSTGEGIMDTSIAHSAAPKEFFIYDIYDRNDDGTTPINENYHTTWNLNVLGAVNPVNIPVYEYGISPVTGLKSIDSDYIPYNSAYRSSGALITGFIYSHILNRIYIQYKNSDGNQATADINTYYKNYADCPIYFIYTRVIYEDYIESDYSAMANFSLNINGNTLYKNNKTRYIALYPMLDPYNANTNILRTIDRNGLYNAGGSVVFAGSTNKSFTGTVYNKLITPIIATDGIYTKVEKNTLLKVLNYIGLPYTLDNTKTYKDTLTGDPDIFIPTTDNDGNNTGNANASNTEKAKNDKKMQDDYDPFGNVTGKTSPESDPTKTISGIDPPADDTNKLPTINLFNRTFALTATEVRSLADELWNADDTKFEEIKNGLALMGGNPIQGLIDLRLYPIDFTQWTGTTEKIVVGRTTLDASGRRIETSTIPQFTADLGTINGQYGNFMDFEPFSIFQIYLPFVGTTDLPANLVIGHALTVKASVDIITGAISYIVKADGYPILYKNGTIGVSIPMTSDNATEYAGNVIHATNNVVQTAGNVTKTIANDTAKATSLKGAITDPSSNVAGAVSTGVDVVTGASAIATAGYDLSTTLNSTTIQQSGTASPSNSLYTSMNVYILQEYHNPAIPDNYAHDVGNACRQSGQISSFSGYTVFSNVDLTGVTATESEKTIILETLQNGVYL